MRDAGDRLNESTVEMIKELADQYYADRTLTADTVPRYVETLVKCGCGNTFQTRSVLPEIKVDICNTCHPFYTGKLKFIDTAGRIEKFKNKFASTGYASVTRGKKGAKAAEAAAE